MKAVIMTGTGGVNQLHVEEIDQPVIDSNELLINTKAFSINPIEVKTRKGNRFSAPLLQDSPSILGWDAAGVVEAVGKNITEFKPGDRVFGIIGFPDFGKTYADYFVAKEKDLCLIPENVDFKEAAVSTIAAITAYQALKYDAKLKKGTKLLIHAASGGVGHLGVQIAKHLGAEVYVTASAEKRDFVMSLGADHFIDYKTEVFEEVLPEMDVVFDLIGGDYIDRSLTILKEGGLLISIPSATNAAVEAKATARKCVGIRFSMKADKADMQAIADLIASGELKPFVSQTFTIDEIAAAHSALEEGHTKGKIAILTTI